MTLHNVDLSALISTRICHDLISPIGAINNGLELLEAIGTAQGPELSLVNDSAASAAAKLNVFRLAFGEANTQIEIKSDHLKKLIADMYGDSRMLVEVQTSDVGIVRIDVKLGLLLLFCVESSLPLGGTCTIVASQNGWSFKAGSSKFKIRRELWDMVTGAAPTQDVAASDVHFLLARLTSDQAGRTIKTHEKEDELIVVVT